MLIKRVYEVDPLCCPECGGQMKVVSFIEPPQREVIEKILRHCGLWQSRAARAPPELDDLVLERDAAFAGRSLEPPDQAAEFQELTYVDIDTFLESFQLSPTQRGTAAQRSSCEVFAYFACIDGHVALWQAQICLPVTTDGRGVRVLKGGRARLSAHAPLKIP
jgi:hypothetical protein